MDHEKVVSLLNKYRIIPRILVVASAIYFGYYALYVTDWYMALALRGVEESAFAASTITLLGGVFKFIFDKYVETGNKE